MKLSREVVLFATGGVGGLLIDTGIVQLLVSFGHCNPYLARIPSFLVAATFTWWWNSHYTFASRRSGRKAHAEWLHWIGLMSLGAMVNYGVYALLLASVAALHRWPAVAVAAGSAVATVVNFTSARGVLFRRPKSSS